MIIMLKTKKKPNEKNITLDKFFSKSEYPTIMGIKGSTQGDRTDAIPAKNEINRPISILYLQ